jgi:predicted ATPase
MKKYVLTGGPGIGKTTLIELLASKGFAIVPEASRSIIEEEKIKGSENLPWKNLAGFQALVAKRQLEAEEEAFKGKNECVFLDRGIVDGKAYSIYGKTIHEPIIDASALKRYDKIFILDKLPEYKNDAERVEDHAFAQEIHDLLYKTYKDFGYEPILVPVLPPKERLEFVLRNI